MTNIVSRTARLQHARRYLALWLPFLATDRLKQKQAARLSRSPEQDNARHLVIVDKVRGALRLAAVCPAAQRLGLMPGLTLADARVRVPDVKVHQLDTRADQVLLARVGVICESFTPRVSLDRPDGIILDITGCAHLFGGEDALRRRLIASLACTGLHVRATITDTPDGARALARFSNVHLVACGAQEKYARRLPIAALPDLTPETITALRRAGLSAIGDLADRPPQILAARFGQSLIEKINRTLGHEQAPLRTLAAHPDIIVERHFPEPLIHGDAINGVLAELISAAVLELQQHGLGGRVFDTHFFRTDNVRRSLRIETSQPTRDKAVVLRLYEERLAEISDPLDPGFGFDLIRIIVPVAEPLAARQSDFDKRPDEEQAALAELIDALVIRFGREGVLRFEALDTHNPLRDSRLVSAADVSARIEAQTTVPQSPFPDGEQGDEPPLRPLQLFEPPQAIETLAEVPDGPPKRFRWRRVMHDVAYAEGPERIEPEWWRAKPGAIARDYYRVEDTQGHRFWIYRRGTYSQANELPRWFLHGVFS